MGEPLLTPELSNQSASHHPRPRRAKKAWQPPDPGCEYLRLEDFPPLYRLPVSTTHHLAVTGKLPFLKVPGSRIMLFPRARVEQIIRSWERKNGRGRRSAPEKETPGAQAGQRTPPAREGKGEAKTSTFESTAQPC